MAKISDQIIRRFAELDSQARSIRILIGHDDSTPRADPAEFYAWSSSALNAIEGAFGSDSAHAASFKKELASVSNNFVWDRKFESIRGIFSVRRRMSTADTFSIYRFPSLAKSLAILWLPQKPPLPKGIMP